MEGLCQIKGTCPTGCICFGPGNFAIPESLFVEYVSMKEKDAMNAVPFQLCTF